VLDLLDGLPAALRELPGRRSWSDDVDHYAGVVAAALPAEAARCKALAAGVGARTAGAPGGSAVHGDLYETSLLLDGDRVSGLLDLDRAGPGRRADDLACLLGHLAVLALEPAHADGTTALLARWLTAFEPAVDPRELHARVAGVVVSLATGPHRVQSAGWPTATRARLALAERWLDGRPLGRPPVASRG
jgi:Ser/Thr protein kinase RdoA (MazF antagonist)